MPNNPANWGARVSKGLRKFSEADPQWWHAGGKNEVDPDTLDMLDPLKSLLAQRYGSVELALKRLRMSKDEAVACGFIAVDAEDAIQLTRLWLLSLRSSRAEAKSHPPLDWPRGPAADDPPPHWYL